MGLKHACLIKVNALKHASLIKVYAKSYSKQPQEVFKFDERD